MQIKVVRGVLARKSSNETTSAETGFVPLTAGVYRVGSEVEGRLEVLREEKPTVYLPLEKLAEYEASGEIVVLR
ncbi:MAG: hypothetical protein Q8K71_15405 [Polaromonas sp.]|nr:hypothetical protein [Hylemonella sp.]MDP1955859.1 hypothetical protein [Polaromonas sp.]